MRHSTNPLHRPHQKMPKTAYNPRKNHEVKLIELGIDRVLNAKTNKKEGLKIVSTLIDCYEHDHKKELHQMQKIVIELLKEAIAKEDLVTLRKLLHQKTCNLKIDFSKGE